MHVVLVGATVGRGTRRGTTRPVSTGSGTTSPTNTIPTSTSPTSTIPTSTSPTTTIPTATSPATTSPTATSPTTTSPTATSPTTKSTNTVSTTMTPHGHGFAQGRGVLKVRVRNLEKDTAGSLTMGCNASSTVRTPAVYQSLGPGEEAEVELSLTLGPAGTQTCFLHVFVEGEDYCQATLRWESEGITPKMPQLQAPVRFDRVEYVVAKEKGSRRRGSCPWYNPLCKVAGGVVRRVVRYSITIVGVVLVVGVVLPWGVRRMFRIGRKAS